MGSWLEADTTKLLYSPGKDTYWEQATLQTFLRSVNYGRMTVTDHSQNSAETASFGSYSLPDKFRQDNCGNVALLTLSAASLWWKTVTTLAQININVIAK